MIKLLNHEKVVQIEGMIPLAKARANADMKHGAESWSVQYHFHMDQLCIEEGLRQGRVKRMREEEHPLIFGGKKVKLIMYITS